MPRWEGYKSGKNAIAGQPHTMPLSGSASLKSGGHVTLGHKPGAYPPNRKQKITHQHRRPIIGSKDG